MLQEKYQKEVIPAMKEKFGYKNDLAVPRIKGTIVNVGIGSSALKDEKTQEIISKDLTLITGQKPVPTLARKAIAGFKTRKGMVVGLKITLRGKRMFEFLSRLINIALPRTRDFRGLSPKSIDQGGNLTIGIKEHIIFPEILGEDIKKIFGLEVTVISNAKTRKEALELFKLLGFPIKKEE
jgi:large subunit ribosomal protein L5